MDRFNYMKYEIAEWQKVSETKLENKWRKLYHVHNRRHTLQVQRDRTKSKIKTRPPKKIQGKDMNRHFTKEEINTAKEYTRKCSTSPVIKLRQIRATMTFSA